MGGQYLFPKAAASAAASYPGRGFLVLLVESQRAERDGQLPHSVALERASRRTWITRLRCVELGIG